MTKTIRNLEITTWILALVAPLFCTWIPALLLSKHIGDTLAQALMFTFFPASPFLVLASRIHTEKRNAKSKSIIVAIYASLTATVISTFLLYICHWRSFFTFSLGRPARWSIL